MWVQLTKNPSPILRRKPQTMQPAPGSGQTASVNKICTSKSCSPNNIIIVNCAHRKAYKMTIPIKEKSNFSVKKKSREMKCYFHKLATKQYFKVHVNISKLARWDQHVGSSD